MERDRGPVIKRPQTTGQRKLRGDHARAGRPQRRRTAGIRGWWRPQRQIQEAQGSHPHSGADACWLGKLGGSFYTQIVADGYILPRSRDWSRILGNR